MSEATQAIEAVDASLPVRYAAMVAENAALREGLAALESDKERIAAERDLFRTQLAAVLKKVFHKTSEKLSAAQLWIHFESLLDDSQRALLEERAKAEAQQQAPRKKRAKAPRGAAAHAASPDVKREREVIEPCEADLSCKACSGALRRIGEDVTSRLHWIPGHFVLRDTVRGRWACSCGLATVVSEPAPEGPIPRSIATPSLLGLLVVSKYADHLPLHRQARMLGRAGVTLPTSTLGDWTQQVAAMLAPLRAALVAEVLAGDIVALDDTRIEVQRNSKKQPKSRCYLWGYLGPGGTVVFDFALTRGGEAPAGFLGDMRGYIQNDGAAAHNALFKEGSGRIRIGCWAHARRRFVHAMESDPERASLAVALIGRLYDVEREARDQKLGPVERARLRSERCPAILEMLRELLEYWAPEVLPKSALGDAVAYTLGQWKTLERYVDDGRLEPDNNRLEAAIRGIALGRKNSLFVGSEQGGRDAALFYSLIESCKAAGVEPMAYLVDVIERIGRTPVSRVADLTPRRWKAAQCAAAAAAGD
ncbi:MAG: IS66 family transposase [bacterium]|nr:IS66 family transposase [bacterium]